MCLIYFRQAKNTGCGSGDAGDREQEESVLQALIPVSGMVLMGDFSQARGL